MDITVKTPNGNEIKINGNLSMDEARDILVGAGVLPAGAPGVSTTTANGGTQYQFANPTATRKG